jgi:phytoene dehydrogenase-like protein
MPNQTAYDAVVVGSGPNGLAAAITFARAGLSVALIEGADTIGGGMRSDELTLPGFTHDICSAVFPLSLASPFLKTVPLADHGLEWVQPPIPLAHPLDDGTAVLAYRSVEETAANLGPDAGAYRRLMSTPSGWAELVHEVLGPLRVPPRYLLALAQFGLLALRPARSIAHTFFSGERARALFAGSAAHAIMPLERPPTGAFGLLITRAAHEVGWPIPRGGAQRLADALASYLASLGGEIITGWLVESINELPPARAVLFDVAPRQLLRIAGRRFTPLYRHQLERFRHGPGVFKVDFALSGPIPWQAAGCAQAGTLHLGGTLDEIATGEAAIWRGEHPEKPFVLLSQPSLFDPARAPDGQHTVWAYCHVPHGSTVDMSRPVEAQIERFAPGFHDLVLARSARTALDMERYNPNCIGGDISGGVMDLRQLFSRPALRLRPYSTPAGAIYLCSASTPPGGGVHGMCGFYAARAALRDVFSLRLPGV